MGFGPCYEIGHEVDGRPVTLVMRKAEEGDAAELAALSDNSVALDFVNLGGAQTVEDYKEWLEKCRTAEKDVYWVVTVRAAGGQEDVVGMTSLHFKQPHRPFSGILLTNTSWWRKGIASLTHRYRTWYAFNEMGAQAIESGFIPENVGSGRALASVGYVEYGRKHRAHLVAGVWRDEVMVTCYNPAMVPVLWPDGDVPAEIREGLAKTQAALDEVRAKLNPR